jgi:hypothetical protein
MLGWSWRRSAARSGGTQGRGRTSAYAFGIIGIIQPSRECGRSPRDAPDPDRGRDSLAASRSMAPSRRGGALRRSGPFLDPYSNIIITQGPNRGEAKRKRERLRRFGVDRRGSVHFAAVIAIDLDTPATMRWLRLNLIWANRETRRGAEQSAWRSAPLSALEDHHDH